MPAQFQMVAKLTNVALQRIANNVVTGGAFVVDGFVVGSGGHDPSNTAVALAPDPTLGDICTGDDCPNIATSLEAVDDVIWSTPTCPVFKCILEEGSYVGPFSQLLLIGTDSNTGAKFVYAVSNSPLKNITALDTSTFYVGVKYG